MLEPRAASVPDEAAGDVRLQVARARPHDLGRGTARIAPAALAALGIAEGDVVEIVGKRRTPAIALRLLFDDRGLDLVRIDGVQRANGGVSIGEYVPVCAATAEPARQVWLAPAPGAAHPVAGEIAIRRALLGRVVVAGDVVALPTPSVAGAGDGAGEGAPTLGLHEVQLRVAATLPESAIVQVNEHTDIELLAEPVGGTSADRRRQRVTYDDVGGLDAEIAQLREMLLVALRHPELFGRLGIDPPRGVLLHGPPGAGKTMLARAVATEEDARFFYVGGPEVMAPRQGESEERLRDVFRQACAQAPAVIFMDDIDALAPRRDQTWGDTERRVVTQLLTLLDGLEPRGRVVVIAATNRPDAIDEALRRPGRFDREIAIGAPSAEGRRQILAVHTRAMLLDTNVDLRALAASAHGFVGADLAALVREAAMEALRRHIGGADLGAATLSPHIIAGLRVGREEFAAAQRRIGPSAMREITVQIPEVSWADVGGLDPVRELLRQGIELPLRRPAAFRRLGIRPAKGFLLFGPPGTGKTLIARAVAHESEANFISVKPSDLLSKWYGESERQIARLFARARQVAPAVIFIDEIDALAPERAGTGTDGGATDRVVNALLAELDGVEALEQVVVVAATNRPTLLDPALLRPGRFDELVYVPAPDVAGRLRILELHTARVPLAADVDLARLAAATEGCTGADLEGLVRRAALGALSESDSVERVPMRCFDAALAATRASVTPEIAREYESVLATLRQEGAFGRRAIGFRREDV